MAWPDTADFPAGWSFPVGYDGTNYDSSWVLDVPNAAPGKAAALKAVPAVSGWAIIQTTSFVRTATGAGVVSFDMKTGAGDGTFPAVYLFLDESGLIVDKADTSIPFGEESVGLSFSFDATGGRTSVGQRYTILLAAQCPPDTLYLRGIDITTFASSGFEPGAPRPWSPVLPPSLGANTGVWPGPLEPYTQLPQGWSFDPDSVAGSPWDVAVPFYPPGASGVGAALDIGNYIDYSGFTFWKINGPVSEVIPAHSTVNFRSLNQIYLEIYVAEGDQFSYDDEYVGDFTLGSGYSGWSNASVEVGDDPVRFVFYPDLPANSSVNADFSYRVLGPRYLFAIDDFQVQPLTVSDGWGSEEVGMIVGGVFRWEPTVIVDDSATAAESVLGVPYTGWFTDPEWPIWHAGLTPYLTSGDPGTAWDFLDDVAYGDQDYGVGVSGTVVFQNSASLDDLATITEELDALNEPVLEGRAIAFDQHEPLTMGPSLAVLADGDELASLSVVASLTLNQDVLADDVQTLRFVRELEDAASADEVVTGTSTHVQVSAGVADQDVIPGASAYLLLVEDAQAVDVVEQGGYALIESTAAAAEDAAPAAVLPLLLSDAVGTSEVLVQAEAPPDVLEGAAAAADDLLAQVTRTASLESTAVAEDLALYAQPGAVALVMNTETAAVSWYENWQFTDMAQVGNTVLAIGPEGLAVLGGNTDAGDRISASLAWGYRDFGSEQKKRVDSFWFGYSATGLLQVGVQTFGQGYGRFVYRMENRQATKGRNNRITPGKGLNARYWKVDISNVAGCAFDVDSMGVELLNSTRRI